MFQPIGPAEKTKACHYYDMLSDTIQLYIFSYYIFHHVKKIIEFHRMKKIIAYLVFSIS